MQQKQSHDGGRVSEVYNGKEEGGRKKQSVEGSHDNTATSHDLPLLRAVFLSFLHSCVVLCSCTEYAPQAVAMMTSTTHILFGQYTPFAVCSHNMSIHPGNSTLFQTFCATIHGGLIPRTQGGRLRPFQQQQVICRQDHRSFVEIAR